MVNVFHNFFLLLHILLILPPDYGKGDHSYARFNLDLAAMISHPNLESIDPSHAQNQLLISTDVKASMKYLQNYIRNKMYTTSLTIFAHSGSNA